MNWHNRYKKMKSALKLTNADISDIIGNTSDSVKSTTQPNKELPRWLKLAIVVFERMSKNVQMDEKHCLQHQDKTSFCLKISCINCQKIKVSIS